MGSDHIVGGVQHCDGKVDVDISENCLKYFATAKFIMVAIVDIKVVFHPQNGTTLATKLTK